MSYTTFAKLRHIYKTRKQFMTISYNINSRLLRMADIQFSERIFFKIRNGTKIPHKYNTVYSRSYPIYLQGRNEIESIRDNCDMHCYRLRDFRFY